MKNFSKIVFVLMTAVFLCRTPDNSFGDQGSVSWDNPAYRGISEYNLSKSDKRTKRNSESQTVCSSYKEFKAALTDRLQARLNTFSITLKYDLGLDEVGSISEQALNEIKASDGYLYWNIVRYESRWEGTDGAIDMDCTADYLTTAGQEEYVRERTAEILSEIISNEMNDEEKVRAVHDWIVLNTRYDVTGTGRSAFDVLTLGSAVCHGYTLTAFEMLREAGIEVLIISGVPEMNHVWNMVKVCGNWYHLDVTYNDPLPDAALTVRYDYFLKSDDEMINASNPHTWESGYPAALLSYKEGSCLSDEITINGTVTDENGDVIENTPVFVRCRNSVRAKTMSDASGYYEFAGFGQGVYVVKISKKGYENEKATVRISESGVYEQNFVLRQKKR
ncbi:MAG: hypothetical protein BWK80_09085 [Desulfobacteraceae bacterium IS3]|nr:MAG: hypothetical protein BWK80_09085 [Desulfobacteraceae bacterium IS3]